MIFVSKDPAVNQAGQRGPSVEPVNGVLPITEHHEGPLSRFCGDDFMALVPQAMREPFPEVWVIVHDESSMRATDAHAVSPQSFSDALGASKPLTWHSIDLDRHSQRRPAYNLVLVFQCVIRLISGQASQSPSHLKAQACFPVMNAIGVFRHRSNIARHGNLLFR
jgi:hypothetical protein